MRDALINSVQRLICADDDYWILCGLRDGGFEEGVRASGFRRYIRSWEQVGADRDLCDKARAGINANVAELLSTDPRVVASSVQRNPSKGADIRFAIHGRVDQALVEVKVVFDCMKGDNYPVVAHDWSKLTKEKRPGIRGFQVVFFTQFPNYFYPAGHWYGGSKLEPPRQVVRIGISNQFSCLSSLMPAKPTWPEAGGPFVHPLRFPGPKMNSALAQARFASVYGGPGGPSAWTFDPLTNLVDAQVGVAVWEI